MDNVNSLELRDSVNYDVESIPEHWTIAQKVKDPNPEQLLKSQKVKDPNPDFI